MEELFKKGYYVTYPPTLKPSGKSIKFKPYNQDEIDNFNKTFNVYFDGQIRENNNVSYYNYISLEIDQDKTKDLNNIFNIWGVKPNYIIDNKYYIFLFDKFISDKSLINTLENLLEFIYRGTVNYLLPLPGTIKWKDGYIIEYKEYSDILLKDDQISFLSDFWHRYKNQKEHILDTTKDNILKISDLKYIPINNIISKLGITYNDTTMSLQNIDKWKINKDSNIIVDLTGTSAPCGGPFFFVLGHKNGKIEETLEWFNVNFDTKFDVVNDDRYINQFDNNLEGYFINNGDGFITNDIGYFSTGDKPLQISDFLIKVFYSIENQDGTKEYIIQLVNTSEGVTTEQIKLEHTFSKTKFKEFFAQYGSFHFYGGDNYIISIHKAITKAPVPIIKTVVGLGFHDNKLILSNGIFNLKTKKLTIAGGNDNFMFDDEGNGYMVVISSGQNMFQVYQKNSMHKFHDSHKILNSADIWKNFKDMYNHDLGLLLLCYIYGQLSYSIFKGFSDMSFPLILSYGLTGTGKTELISTYAKIFGVHKAGMQNFAAISSFAFTSLASSFSGIPIFFNEFRNTGVTALENKLTKIRSLYDGTSDAKGRSDQSIISYKLTSLFALDGEEGIRDPAIRSRSILIQMGKRYKLSEEQGGVGKFKELTSNQIIDNLLYTYLRKVDYDYNKYNKYFIEGLTHFKSSETRICENFARMYAGVMMFDMGLKQDAIEILKKYFQINVDDQVESQGVKEFFKNIAMNINNINSYTQDGEPFIIDNKSKILYLRADKIWEYFRLKHVKMSLEFDTYMGYMEDAGYEYSLFDLGDKMCYAVKIPIDEKIPKELLVIKEVYDIHKILFAKTVFQG